MSDQTMQFPYYINITTDHFTQMVRVEVEPVEPRDFDKRYAVLFPGEGGHERAEDYVDWLLSRINMQVECKA